MTIPKPVFCGLCNNCGKQTLHFPYTSPRKYGDGWGFCIVRFDAWDRFDWKWQNRSIERDWRDQKSELAVFLLLVHLLFIAVVQSKSLLGHWLRTYGVYHYYSWSLCARNQNNSRGLITYGNSTIVHVPIQTEMLENKKIYFHVYQNQESCFDLWKYFRRVNFLRLKLLISFLKKT